MTPLLALCLLVAQTHVQPTPIVEPSISGSERLLTFPLPTALDGRLTFDYLANQSAPDIAVAIRLNLPLTPERSAALEHDGCRLDRLPNGQLANVGTVLSGVCTWDALWAIAARPWVKRVEPMRSGLAPAVFPQSTTDRETEASQLREAVPASNGGAGVVIADIDSGIDPFHPFLFRADGGAFRWIDVNDNARFDPGLDCVDLNRNGKADPGERLLVLKAPVANLINGETANTAADFLAGLDWLYQDENEDGTRNQGSEPPYGDLKDTFGEQLYLADDVNGNGALDVEERLMRLKTPKIKAVLGWAPGDAYSKNPSVTYRRGENLSKVTASYPREDLSMHGTLIAGTLVGGTPGLTRYSGIAPDADLVVASWNSSNQLAALAWAKSEGAQIVNWELAKFIDEYLDGSTFLEDACDQASAAGILQIAAAGNLGGLQKHRKAMLQSGTRLLPITIPSGQARSTTLSLRWRNAPSTQLTFSLEVNGTTVAMTAANGTAQAGADTIRWGSATSVRSTHLRTIQVFAPTGQVLNGQVMNVVVYNSGSPVDLDSFVSDNYSGWGQGVRWSEEATDEGTYCSPSTSDTTLAIGTYRLDYPTPGLTGGMLAPHSPRGPRIDGQDSIDLVAPEDHITSVRLPGGAFGLMAIGSGTSNAAPMVTGVAALLKALDLGATPMVLRERLRSHAFSEPQMGPVPNDAWGAGKLRAYQAAQLGVPVESGPPIARGTATRFSDRIELDATTSSDPEGEPLTARWDVDYDGEFESGPLSVLQFTSPSTPALGPWVKLEVSDPHGRTGRALILINDAIEDADAGIDGGTEEAPPGPQPRGCGCSTTPAALTWLLALAVRRRIHTARRSVARRSGADIKSARGMSIMLRSSPHPLSRKCSNDYETTE